MGDNKDNNIDNRKRIVDYRYYNRQNGVNGSSGYAGSSRSDVRTGSIYVGSSRSDVRAGSGYVGSSRSDVRTGSIYAGSSRSDVRTGSGYVGSSRNDIRKDSGEYKRIRDYEQEYEKAEQSKNRVSYEADEMYDEEYEGIRYYEDEEELGYEDSMQNEDEEDRERQRHKGMAGRNVKDGRTASGRYSEADKTVKTSAERARVSKRAAARRKKRQRKAVFEMLMILAALLLIIIFATNSNKIFKSNANITPEPTAVTDSGKGTISDPVAVTPAAEKEQGNGENGDISLTGTPENDGEGNKPDEGTADDNNSDNNNEVNTNTDTENSDGGDEGKGTDHENQENTDTDDKNQENTGAEGGNTEETGDTGNDVNNPQSENPDETGENNGKTDEQEKRKVIAFTFDDGPYPPVTNRILDVLEEYGMSATFFVMGDRTDDYPDTILRESQTTNCQVGNHTYGHKQLTKLTVDEIYEQVEGSEQLIANIIGHDQLMLRPPYGSKSEYVSENVDVPMILWSVDSRDWESKNAEKVMDEILSVVQDGDIVLMHDLYPSTAEAVEKLVPMLVEMGYDIVSVEELFERKGIELETGKWYYNAR